MKAFDRVEALLTQVALAAIAFYQGALRPLNLWGCKFYPTCSDYARQAIESRGLWSGLGLAGRRLLRCRPGTFGGYDPVPDEACRAHEMQWQN